MKHDAAITLLEIPTGKCCRLCGHKRPYSSFVWRDATGNEGVSQRCERCRNRGYRSEPGMPALRYPITKHAIERFVERVRPDLDMGDRSQMFVAARREMRRLMATAQWAPRLPEWTGKADPHGAKEPPGCLIVIPGRVCFQLSRKRGRVDGAVVVVTVLTALHAPTAENIPD